MLNRDTGRVHRRTSLNPSEDATAATSLVSAICFVATITALRPFFGASSKIRASRFSLQSLPAIRARVVGVAQPRAMLMAILPSLARRLPNRAHVGANLSVHAGTDWTR